MKIFALIIVIIGAVICYGAKTYLKKIKNQDPIDEKTLVYIKLSGLIAVIVGFILIFIS